MAMARLNGDRMPQPLKPPIIRMPIRPENKARYPKDWAAISARIKERAGGKCEECGVGNGDLGGRLAISGQWCPAQPIGDNGLRLTWPEPGSLAWCMPPHGAPILMTIVRIVLTVAHLNHTPEDCRDENLRAWCQRCHNRYDSATRRKGIAARAKAGRALGDFFDG